MKLIDTRELIRRAVAEQANKVAYHGRENLSRGEGYFRAEHGRAIVRIAELDPESATAADVAAGYAAMGVPGERLTPLCDECGRHVPAVVEVNAHGYEAEGAWLCPECLAKALEVAGAAVPA